MNQPTSSNIEAVAREGLALGGSARAEFLDRACGRDAALRAGAEAMIAEWERATQAGEYVPVPKRRADPRRAEQSKGRRLGAYTILEVLGEGGMGTVYLAEQDRPRRTVALKVIRPGALSPRLLRRFEIESQLLGRLQHPGIAQVYEAATADTGDGPQPFFAMELVRGEPLTNYAREKHLGPRERLALFEKVCDAVQHAHVKGVIHRDLKPGNILVDDQGQPKVLDFGIARATDADVATATFQTEAGALVGTIPYMSPEQIAGDAHGLDTRSDVYTLGVILYELLAGRLPHAVLDKTIPEAARIIREDEAPSLGSVDAHLRGDVQTIVAKAMEKDKARRYQSAADLGADITRFLADEPILARPPSRAYLASKFVRRNRALVAGAVAVAAALVAGTIATAWQAAQAREEAQTATSVNEFLIGMLKAANPDAGNATDMTVAEMVDRAAEQLAARPPASGRVALSLHHTLSDTYRALGKGPRALEEAERAVAIAKAAYGEDHLNSMEAKRSLAMALGEVARFDEAEAIVRDNLDRLTRRYGPVHVQVGLALGDVGRVEYQKGRFAEAEPLIRRSYEIVAPALGETHDDALVAMDHLGSVLHQLGRFAEAEEILRRAVALREQVYGPESTVTAFSINSLANAVQKQGRNEEAAELLSRTLAIRRKRLPPEHPSVLVAMSNLSVALASMNRLDEAEPLLRESMEAQIRVLGEAHPKTLSAMGNLAYVLEDQGKLDEAEALYRRVVENRRGARSLADTEAWPQMNNLAMLLMKRGKVTEAEPVFAEILSLSEGRLPPGHYFDAIIRNNYGECLARLERFVEAEKHLLASQTTLTEFFKEGHPRVKKGMERLATLYTAWGKPDRAAEFASPEPSKPDAR